MAKFALLDCEIYVAGFDFTGDSNAIYPLP